MPINPSESQDGDIESEFEEEPPQERQQPPEKGKQSVSRRNDKSHLFQIRPTGSQPSGGQQLKRRGNGSQNTRRGSESIDVDKAEATLRTVHGKTIKTGRGNGQATRREPMDLKHRENKFLTMKERNWHKKDTEIDKKLAVEPPVERNRKPPIVEAECMQCGDVYEVNIAEANYDEGEVRFKCDRCILGGK